MWGGRIEEKGWEDHFRLAEPMRGEKVWSGIIARLRRNLFQAPKHCKLFHATRFFEGVFFIRQADKYATRYIWPRAEVSIYEGRSAQELLAFLRLHFG